MSQNIEHDQGGENLCKLTFDTSKKVKPASPEEKVFWVLSANKENLSINDFQRSTGLHPEQIDAALEALIRVGGIQQDNGNYSLDSDPDKVFKLLDWITKKEDERFGL